MPSKLPIERRQGGPSGAKLRKLRAAFQACHPNPPANPSQPTPAQRRRARQAVKRQAQAIATFRACLGRHGLGPEAHGGAPKAGEIRKAFTECRKELPHAAAPAAP